MGCDFNVRHPASCCSSKVGSRGTCISTIRGRMLHGVAKKHDKYGQQDMLKIEVS
jgi:hypothetical protein